MADVTYRPDRRGMGEWLVGPEAHALVQAAAEAAIPIAKALSPDALPKGVGYIDSFQVDVAVESITRRPSRRAVATLANTSEYATAVELGWDLEHHQFANHAGYHVLARVKDTIEGII